MMDTNSSSPLRTEDDPMEIDEMVNRLGVIARHGGGKVSGSVRLLLREYENRKPIFKLGIVALRKYLP